MSAALLSITPRPDLGILVVRWADDAPRMQLEEHYVTLLAAAQEHNIWRWLLDVRRRDHLDPELGRWTTHVFYPKAAALATAPLCMAVHCSPARLAVYESDEAQREYITYGTSKERPYQLHLFIEEGPAMQWLLA